jgi:hypothetical protein
MRRKTLFKLFVISGAIASPVLADGVDLVPYLTRVGGHKSALVVTLLIIVAMMFNYFLNLLVIALPSRKETPHTFRRLAYEIIGITLIGQLADRLGALLAFLSIDPLIRIFNLHGEKWALPLILINFFFPAVVIFFVVFFFTSHRWLVPKAAAITISAVAAFVTNPSWALLIF